MAARPVWKDQGCLIFFGLLATPFVAGLLLQSSHMDRYIAAYLTSLSCGSLCGYFLYRNILGKHGATPTKRLFHLSLSELSIFFLGISAEVGATIWFFDAVKTMGMAGMAAFHVILIIPILTFILAGHQAAKAK